MVEEGRPCRADDDLGIGMGLQTRIRHRSRLPPEPPKVNCNGDVFGEVPYRLQRCDHLPDSAAAESFKDRRDRASKSGDLPAVARHHRTTINL
jgi:hypothetical protein